jgi:hypothetical protein
MARQSLQSGHVGRIERDRKVIDGLDQLEIELVSVNLYQSLLWTYERLVPHAPTPLRLGSRNPPR